MLKEEFIGLISSETGLDVSDRNFPSYFDDLDGWSSIMMLMIASGYERETGKKSSIPRMFESKSLEELWKHLSAL